MNEFNTPEITLDRIDKLRFEYLCKLEELREDYESKFIDELRNMKGCYEN